MPNGAQAEDKKEMLLFIDISKIAQSISSILPFTLGVSVALLAVPPPNIKWYLSHCPREDAGCLQTSRCEKSGH